MLKTFAYHKPSEDGLAKIAEIREAYSVVHDAITKNAPPSRERSVALTELETSAMWAVKSVVFNDPESVVDSGTADHPAPQPLPPFVRGNVIRNKHTGLKIVVRPEVSPNNGTEWELVCETPHQDGDFSYLCGSAYCRCSS